MADREKLIELIFSTPRELSIGMRNGKSFMSVAKIADHLIANGVTVQEWIPASEPPKDDLPVLVTCGKGYRPFVARYDLIWKRWRVSHTLKITHWQPLPSTRDLPHPPKGE